MLQNKLNKLKFGNILNDNIETVYEYIGINEYIFVNPGEGINNMHNFKKTFNNFTFVIKIFIVKKIMPKNLFISWKCVLINRF